MSKKKIITMEQLKKENPWKYTRVLLALQRNQVKPKESKNTKPKNEPTKRNFTSDFGKNEIMKYITNRILNN